MRIAPRERLLPVLAAGAVAAAAPGIVIGLSAADADAVSALRDLTLGACAALLVRAHLHGTPLRGAASAHA